MSAYTFHSLSDADFEDLAGDLLRASLGITFQSFTKGRDSGIDLLHGMRLRNSTVVQCKHYCRSRFANLKSSIAKEEVPKLAEVKPSRFILVTSLGLTPQNKEEVLSILTPYCKGVDDIYGQDDINTLLRQHPTVEESHYKLWLTSVPVLQRVLRHGAAVWNAMTREDIERKMSLYVQTEAYGAALGILAKYHYCVLSGIPGIGKTTLAQVLVTRLMDEGFELIAVRDDIQEAFEALDLTKKQVVYYDDFLGQSSISERLGKNEDRGIVRLLAESRRANHLKVIFTTREYILEDAKRVYEPLNSGDLDVAKCVVKVEDYTRGHRARILYNHIYFSSLPLAYAAALLCDRAYRRIVDHKSYSPRIIEWMTVKAGSAGVRPESYVAKFMQVLDDPTQLWQHAFENQIGEDARAILYCLGTVEGWLGLDELRDVWARLRGLSPTDVSSIESKRAFRAAMKQLDGSFLRTNRAQNETAVEFHNPSIKDYVRSRIASDADVKTHLLRTAQFFEQISCLVHLSSAGQVTYAPHRLIPDDAVFHEAVARTLDAKAATFDWIRYRAEGELRLTRRGSDVGKRLTTIARWAKAHQSAALLQLSCRLAADMVASGDVAKAATIESCGFLDAVIEAYPEGEQTAGLLRPFLAQIDEYLSEQPSSPEWSEWTSFVKMNGLLFDAEEMAQWRQRAESFCTSEIDTIMGNAESTSEAEEWYEEVASVATNWDVSLESQAQRFQEWLKELQRREEKPDRDDDDWRGSRSADRMSGSDAEIDRLFDSLNVRASE